MRRCIPTDDDRGPAASAAGHFGRAPFFTLADVEDATARVLEHPGCHAHVRACRHVPFLKARHVDAVVWPGIGRRAAAGSAPLR